MSFKNDGRETSRCELPEDFRAALSGNGFVRDDKVPLSKQKVEPSSRRYESETARKIDQSISYMRQHLDKPLQVATLAGQANISPSHFFVLFKRRTGYPPIDFFIRLRMERACQLLGAGSLHVKEVAAAMGYDDPFYFSRVFKAVNRIAPSEYCAQQKKLKKKIRRMTRHWKIFPRG